MTKRFVDVPIVVVMPPTSVENPTGNRISEAGLFVLIEMLVNMGRSRTTIGTLLTKALSTPPTINIKSKEIVGFADHSDANVRPIGSSAPVRISPWPAIIKAQTAIRAS